MPLHRASDQIDLSQLFLVLYINPDPTTSVGVIVESLEWRSSASSTLPTLLPTEIKEVYKFLMSNDQTRCGLIIRAESEKCTTPYAISIPDLTFMGSLVFSSLEVSRYVQVESFTGVKCRLDIKVLKAHCQRGSRAFNRIHFMENLEELWLDESNVRRGFAFLNTHRHLRVLSLSDIKPIGKGVCNISLGDIQLGSIERLHIDGSWCSEIDWSLLENLKYLQVSYYQVDSLPSAYVLPKIEVLDVVLIESMITDSFNPKNLPFFSHLKSLKYPLVRYVKKV